MIRKITQEMRPYIFAARDLSSNENDKPLAADYDVCVIGSGPGGSVAAATLAQSGLKVALVERGPFLPADDSNFRALDMSNRMGHIELTSGLRTILYQGNAVGGGSLLYGAVAMKPPQFVFDEWKELSGAPEIDRDKLEPHYRHVVQVMSVTEQTRELENEPNAIVRRMADALGKPDGLETVSRYTEGCAGVGLCSFGCGFDLKGNMINSFLPLALATGNLTVFAECEAQTIAGEKRAGNFKATGLDVEIRDFAGGQLTRRARINARAFVVAAGAFFSSALLLRNRETPSREKIGAKVYLQPHAQIFALFDGPVTKRGTMKDGQYIPYNGVPSIYNFTGFLRERGFFWLASILFPANLASFISHLPPEEHFEMMKRFHRTMSVTLTLRDDPARSRIKIKDGRAQLDFRESRQDIENLRQCFLLAARGFLAVGARRVFLPMLRPPKIERESDLKQVEKMKFGYDDLLLYSDHTSGGNAYGKDPERGVVDAGGRLFGSENVYVADSSLFPTASGINPSWTIMALSHRVSSQLAKSLG
ncbi:MAG TPA: GMC family oxidoreductase [Blastocatellia bacterium]|jgi:choline dehydrogenase-like flavoprotein|nr:GMC family oxidoreductase [Blastocatellia bacterium]